MEKRPVIRVTDLVVVGASRADVRRSTAGLERMAAGAYADTSHCGPEEVHVTRTRAQLGRLTEVVASHTTAAVLWEIPVPRARLSTVHVSPTAGRLGKPKCGRGYHIHDLSVHEGEAVDLDGIPATNPVRTVLDCARLLDRDFDWAVAAADAALHGGLLVASDLAQAAAGVHTLRGAARARALPSLCSALAESPGESLLRLRLMRMGLELVEQYSMPWVEGNPRVDFLVEGRLVVEFDGEGKYELNGNPARAHWLEKLRHDRIVEAGHPVVHVTWAHLWDEPALSRRVHRALRQAQALTYAANPPATFSPSHSDGRV